MAGILPERVKELYGLPPHHEAVTGLALGYPGHPETLPEDLRQRELTERRRNPSRNSPSANGGDR
jgi:hypothetical protein